MTEKIAVSWSGGKDSALALYRLLQAGRRVEALVTTVTAEYERIAIHGVREELLEAQAAALGLPLRKVYIPKACTNEVYEQRMGEGLAQLKGDGFTHLMFGDIFLADVRAYRERLVEPYGLERLYPLWGEATDALAQEFMGAGFRAVITCVDTQAIGASFAGREYDAAFLADLPPQADPCGENGEFHSFVFTGPPFTRPVPVALGRVEDQGRFVYRDLIPSAE